MNKEVIFGNNFKKYRKKKGISQKEFARLLYEATGKQLTLTSVSNYETGLHLPPSPILPVVAEILEVSIDRLFGVEMETEAEIEEPELVKEWRVLAGAFQAWKQRNSGRGDSAAMTGIALGEQLLELGKQQQKELRTAKAQLAAVRKMIEELKSRLK